MLTSSPGSRNPSRVPNTVLLAILLCLAACNSNKTPSSAASQSETSSAPTTTTAGGDSALPDPCKLITKDEAEAILGEPVRDPEPGDIGGNKICDYQTIKVHGGVLPYSIHIAITPEQQQVWDAGKKLHAGAKELRPVAGLGDDAYFLLDDLEILSKQRSIAINVMKNIDRPDHAKAVEEAEKMVAQKSLPRM